MTVYAEAKSAVLGWCTFGEMLLGVRDVSFILGSSTVNTALLGLTDTSMLGASVLNVMCLK